MIDAAGFPPQFTEGQRVIYVRHVGGNRYERMYARVVRFLGVPKRHTFHAYLIAPDRGRRRVVSTIALTPIKARRRLIGWARDAALAAAAVCCLLAAGCAGALSGADLFGGRGDRLRAEEHTKATYCGGCHYTVWAEKEHDYKRNGKPPLKTVSDLLSDHYAVYNHSAEPLLAGRLGDDVVNRLLAAMKSKAHASVVVPAGERAALFNYLACQQFYQSMFHCGRADKAGKR